jgi:hypothetical protein
LKKILQQFENLFNFVACFKTSNIIIMSVHEQEELKKEYYSEALRYMDNAKEYLKNAKKEGDFYNDKKYVKTACGTAYSGLLVGMNGFLQLKDIKGRVKERKSIEYYQRNITKIDRKMLNTLNSAYEILHLWGYYDGITSVKVVKEGFDFAYTLIDKIKPSNGIASYKPSNK